MCKFQCSRLSWPDLRGISQGVEGSARVQFLVVGISKSPLLAIKVVQGIFKLSRVYNYRIAIELLIWVHQYPHFIALKKLQSPKLLFPDSNLSGEEIAL